MASNRMPHTILVCFLLCLLPLLSKAFKIVAPQAAVDDLKNNYNNFEFRPILGVGFSAPIPSEGIEADLWFVDPAANDSFACNPTEDFVDMAAGRGAGKVVMLQRGGCAFWDKGYNVEQTGAKAMVVYSNTGTTQADSLSMLGNGTILDIVVEGLSLFEGLIVKNLTAVYGTLTVRIFQSPTNTTQRAALQELYDTCNGPAWTYGSLAYTEWGNKSLDPCVDVWSGITCTVDGQVSIVSLGQVGVNCKLPDSFAIFDSLTVLDFSQNGLTGTMPEYFQTFTKLQQLLLPNNYLTGTVPPYLHLIETLEILDLSNNNLGGSINPGFFYLQNLLELHLNNNNFYGSIPNDMSLPSLELLNLNSNFFTADLNALDLSSLNVDPNVAPVFYLMDLGQNLLQGTIPSTFGRLSSLVLLTLGSNNLTGPLPSTFTNLTSLRYLDISNNSFAGDVPSDNLPPYLRFLIASHNQYNTIPVTFSNHKTLVSLDLSYNDFSVSYTQITSRLPIPVSKIDVSNGYCLESIDFSHNRITATEGTFQVVVYQWESLISFKFNDNNINTPLQLLGYDNPYLKTLDLSNNGFIGTIPPEFNNFLALTEFNLTGNNLHYNKANNYLPLNWYPDYEQVTYFSEMHLNCPTIRMSPYDVEATIGPEYYAYELCQCEPNYRRKAIDNASETIGQQTGQPQFECVACPEVGMFCPGRGNDTMFIIRAHYYPTPSLDDPQQLIDCPSCVGTDDSGEFRCEENHAGRLCTICTNNTFLRGSSCEKCAPIGTIIVGVSIFVLVILIIGFTMFTLLQRQLCGGCFSMSSDSFFNKSPTVSPTSSPTLTPKDLSASTQSQADEAALVKPGKMRPTKDSSVAALLIAINFYQTVSALSQYYELPVSINQLLAAMRVVTSVTGAGVGLECLHEKLHTYKYLYMAIMLEPVFCIAGVLLIYAIGKLYMFITKRTPVVLHEWEISCLKMGLFVINLLFFPITSAAINAFRCTADPVTGIRYNSAYPYQECNDISIAGRVFAILLYSIGVIFLFSSLIFVYVRKAAEDTIRPGTTAYVIQRAFGFFFLHFRDRYYGFAIVILLRRFVISLITSLVRVDSVLAFGLNNLVLVSSAFVVLVKKPFRTHIDNLLETTTILCCLFIYGAAILMDAPGFTYGAVVIEVFYFMINAIVLLWCAFEFARTYLPTILKFFKKSNKTENSSSNSSEMS